MSEIDPMVHDLMWATRERTLFWEGKENYLARKLTARLAQSTVSREQIREAIRSFPYLLIPPVTYGYDVDRFLDDFANHVMAVIAPDTAGGE